MVAPILSANQRSRYVYFPAGNWYALDGEGASAVPGIINEGLGGGGGSNDTGGRRAFAGGQSERIECPLGQVPAFVREGAVLALADIMQSTQDYDASAITFHAFGSEAEGRYFEDDGHSLDYQKGQFNEWKIKVSDGRFEATSLHKGLAQAAFDAPGRYFFQSTHGGGAVSLG